MTLRSFYGLPKKVVFCKKTLISNQRPSSEIEFAHNINTKKRTNGNKIVDIPILDIGPKKAAYNKKKICDPKNQQPPTLFNL